MGCGAGYDAYESCRNGTHYVGIDITPENPERTRKHLGFYGYTPQVITGDAENLPFKTESFEILFSVGVLHHTPDIKKSFLEAFRVLKGGGEFWIVVYHKNSIFYRIHLFLFNHVFQLGFLKRSLKERLSMIEFTTSNVRPLVNVYTRTSLRKLLTQAGFTIESLYIRRLKAEEFPPIPLIWKMWRFIPQRWLDIIGKAFGWYLIAKAKKL